MKTIYKIIPVFILIAIACRNQAPPPAAELPVRVRTVTLLSEAISIPVHASGILMTSEEIKLSFKAGGIAGEINVREGDKVKKNSVLALLNPAEINANVKIAENAYNKALRDWKRAKNLYADTVATLEQYQNAVTALEIAKSSLEIAKFNQNHSVIRAPADGIILKQLVRENELISAGYPVFLFGVSGESWKVKTGLSDRDIVRINPGDSASISFDAYPGITFPAEVEQISGISDPQTGTYDVGLLLNDSGYRLAAGFIAKADIFPSKKSAVLKVPVGAVIDADGETGYVYIVDTSGKAIKTRISIVAIIGSYTAISGIAGETREIVSEGAAYLRDGEKVEIVNRGRNE